MFSKFSLNEKIQIIKWYIGGNTFATVTNLSIKKYGYGPSASTLQCTLRNFDKNGCIQFNCRKCTEKFTEPPKPTDEEELNELLVCAAAELELSIRHISRELDLSIFKINCILQQYGYSKSTKYVKEKTKIPKLSDEKKQIIRWYCLKNSLVEMIKLSRTVFPNISSPRSEIIDSVKHFEMYGCLRECDKCLNNINNEMKNLTMVETEKLIFRWSRTKK